MRTRILALLPLLASSLLYAQSQYAQITATNITDAAGNKLVSGSITFTPVNNAGTPIAPHATSGGRVVPRPVVFKVVNGVITPSYGTAQLVDVTQTNPVNICYADRIHDNLSGNTWSPDPCVQPAYNASWCSVSNGVTTCNFDNYQPTSTPGAIVQTGPIGASGPNCATTSPAGECDLQKVVASSVSADTVRAQDMLLGGANVATKPQVTAAVNNMANSLPSGLASYAATSKKIFASGASVYTCSTVTDSTANAFVVSTLYPTPSKLVAGQVYSLKFPNGNSAAATLTVRALGTKAIKVISSLGAVLSMVGGEIVTGPAWLYYDGSEFIYSTGVSLTNPVSAGVTATQANFSNRDTFYLAAGSETLTLPCSSTISPNGQIFIFAYSGTATIAVTSGCTTTDSIGKNGSSGTSQTIAQGAALAAVVTDGAGHYYVSGD
jgi:hypothetical protein